ncbi:TPA: CBS domain-containing protein [Streptococcus suis]
MNENRFLELFNDLDKVLRKVCQVEDGEHADVGSMLAKAKDLSPVNPVQANWDNLYVARQLRNLMVHERRTGLKEVAQPSQELISVLERVIEEYERPLTLEQYLQTTSKPTPIVFQANDRVQEALAVIEREHFSKFPIFSDKGYQGLVSENGLTNWLAKASQQATSLQDLVYQTNLGELLAFEETSLQVRPLSAQASLYQLVAIFEEYKRAAVLVSKQKDARIQTPSDLIGIVTSQDLAEIYMKIG